MSLCNFTIYESSIDCESKNVTKYGPGLETVLSIIKLLAKNLDDDAMP